MTYTGKDVKEAKIMKQPKTVQIPVETFSKLVDYFMYNNHSECLYEAIKSDIDHKIDKMVARDIYMETHGIITKGDA